MQRLGLALLVLLLPLGVQSVLGPQKGDTCLLAAAGGGVQAVAA